jgi:hypothetical protein
MRAAVKRGITYGLMMTAGILLAVGVWRTEGVRGPAANTTGRVSTASIDEEILAQMKDLFGAQLNGVVEYAGESPDIQLSESAAGEAEGQAQPVVIELRRGGEIVRTLGFSGRSICMKLAGEETCIEPLATGAGDVIVTANHFCWTPQHPGGELRGYRVVASLLTRS